MKDSAEWSQDSSEQTRVPAYAPLWLGPAERISSLAGRLHAALSSPPFQAPKPSGEVVLRQAGFLVRPGICVWGLARFLRQHDYEERYDGRHHLP
jgi:hypothetical protein